MSALSYTHPYFNPQRCPSKRSSLAPPFQAEPIWNPGLVRFPPKISDGKLFLSGLAGTIDAYDLDKAERVWQFKLPGPLDLSNLSGHILAAGKDVITRHGNQIFILDANTGTPQLVKESPYFDLQSAVFRGFDLIAFDVTPDLKRFCLAWSVREGETKWKYPLEYPADFITVADELVVFVSEKSRVTCLTASTGEIRWAVDIEPLLKDNSHSSQHLIKGAVLSYAELFVVGVEPCHIVAIEKNTGNICWIQQLKTESVATTACYPNSSIFVVDSQFCYQLSAEDGSIRRELFIDSQRKKKGFLLFTLPTPTDGFLYFSDVHTGTFVALNLETGDFCWEYTCGAKIPIFNAPVIFRNRVFIVDAKGHFYAFRGNYEISTS